MSAVKRPTTKRQSSENHAPTYDDATKAKLLRFLVAYLTEAQMTLSQTKETAGEHYHLPVYANKIKYHESQVSTIRWLICKVFYRQRHFLEFEDETIDEVVKQCVEQSKT